MSLNSQSLSAITEAAAHQAGRNQEDNPEISALLWEVISLVRGAQYGEEISVEEATNRLAKVLNVEGEQE